MESDQEPQPASAPPASAPASPAPVPAPPAATSAPAKAGTDWAIVAFVLAAVALLVAAASWYQSSMAIADLRQAQRNLLTDLAAGKRTAVIDVAGAPALGPASA